MVGGDIILKKSNHHQTNLINPKLFCYLYWISFGWLILNLLQRGVTQKTKFSCLIKNIFSINFSGWSSYQINGSSVAKKFIFEVST